MKQNNKGADMAKNIEKYFLVSIALLMTLVPAVYAQDAGKYINDAAKYYNTGEYSKALDSLKKAEGKISVIVAEKVVSILPPAPAGFVIGKSMERESEMGFSERSSRKYKSLKTPGAEIEIVIVPVSSYQEETGDLAEVTGVQTMSVSGRKALLNFDAGTQSGVIEIYLTNAKVCVYSTGFPDSDMLVNFSKHIDFSKIDSLFR